jgi:hypothetical protein
MPGTPLLPFGTRTLLLGGLLIALAACASTGSGSAASSDSGSGATSGAQSSPGSVGSAATAGTARPGPPGTSAVPLPVDPVCSPAPAALTARFGEQPRPVCLRAGQSLTITMPPSPGQPWQSMTTTDAAVLACTSQAADQGARTATCRALRPGLASVSTTTAPFAGDPHGPPQYTWTLTIHVQPASQPS